MPNTYIVDAADNTAARAAGITDEPKRMNAAGTAFEDDTSVVVLPPDNGKTPVAANAIVVDPKAREACTMTLTTRIPLDSPLYNQTDGSTMPTSPV
jgi:hypothetical protein